MYNQETIQKWIDALVSGKYTQGLGQLTVENPYTGEFEHCCLGVACEVYQQEVGDLSVEINESENHHYSCEIVKGKSYDDESAILPVKVKNWLGLDETSPTIGWSPLVTLNDEGYTFDEIAEIIQEKYIR